MTGRGVRRGKRTARISGCCASCAGSMLTQRLNFHKATRSDLQNSILSQKRAAGSCLIKFPSSAPPPATKVDPNLFLPPPMTLCPPERVTRLMHWNQPLPVGGGCENMGNTCFLNSVLQCLTYTVPLANLMLSREHTGSCTALGFCLYCALEKHIIAVLNAHRRSVAPKDIVRNLQSLSARALCLLL